MMLTIYGAGGAGRAVLETVKQLQAVERRWESICFVEDAQWHREDRLIYGIPVWSVDAFMSQFSPEECQFAISLGEPAVRDRIFRLIKEKGYSLATVVHPSVYVPDSTVLSEGVIALPCVYLDPDVTVGENTFLHPFVTVGHDTKLGRSVVCTAGASIAGNVEIGDRTYIAMHVAVHEKIKIGSDAIIGMGSMVQRDIPDNVIAMGNPARPMKHKDDSNVFK